MPHTEDEIKDHRSTLYYPRYNPSLFLGRDIKNKLGIEAVFDKEDKFGYEDQSIFILYDNRTICRRQLVRSLSEDEGRIFVSKLMHGPGNALTYYSCKNKIPYLASPSDLSGSLEIFDKIYKVNSQPAMKFFNLCRESLDYEKALKLMNWYEHMIALVLNLEENREIYQKICSDLGKIEG